MAPPEPAANLLLITFDQWRGDWGDPHDPVVDLPALQELAAEGWSAQRCITASPHCVPARMSWITGLQPSQLGVTRNSAVSLPRDAPSVVRPLQELGWHTALIGKTHWSSHHKTGDLREHRPLLGALGFDTVEEVAGPRALRRMECALTDAWRAAGVLEAQRADLTKRYGQGRTAAAWTIRPSVLPQALYPDIWIADRGLELLDSMPSNQPWLLWISFTGPHEPFDTPAPWHGLHSNSALPLPTPKPSWIDSLPQHAELKRCADGWRELLTPEQIQACRADYADHLKLLNDQLQNILQKLNQRSDADNTAVALTSDHGDMLGDAGMLYKGTFLESAIRVPFIYRAPKRTGHNPQNLSNQALALTDLLGQILEGLPRGGALQPILRWGARQPGAVAEFANERLYVRGQRKLCLDVEGVPIWATDLAGDPSEQINVWPRGGVLHPRWQRLKSWAQRDQALRSQPGWLWRRLANP